MEKGKDNQVKTTLNLSSDFYAVPTNKSKMINGRDYVYWGEDNDYPGYLDSLKQQSEHGAVLKSKIEWIALGGVDKTDLSEPILQWLEDNDIDDFIYKITKDFETYGGFTFHVIRTRDGEGIASIEYQEFNKVRHTSPKEIEDGKGEFVIGEDWSKYRTEVEFVNSYKKDGNEPKSLYYYKGYTEDFYPEPPYFEGIHGIETLLRLDKFHLNLVKKGFFIPTVITFKNGVPNEEAKHHIQHDFKEAFTSEENAGGFIMLFNEPDEEIIDIQTLKTDELDEKFTSISEAKEQDIFTAHKVTSPMLFGIKTEGQLGGRTEMVDAWELFNNIYIKPHQNLIMGCLNSLLSNNWEDINLKLNTIPPVEPEISDETLTITERRKKHGLTDEELSEQEVTMIRLKDMPSEIQKAFVGTLTTEQLHELVGYNRTENEIEDEEIDNEQE